MEPKTYLGLTVWMVLIGVFLFVLLGCTIRIDDEYPKVGSPYQKVFLMKEIRL